MDGRSEAAPAGGIGAARAEAAPAWPPRFGIERLAAYPWIVIAITCIGAAMGQFDASVVQLALPALSDIFAERATVTSWVALAYVLSFSAFLPIFGRLCEKYGRKRLYLAGMLVFVVGSVLCAIAETLPVLIACRVLQGIGGSVLGANSIAILSRAAGKERRPRAMGIFAAAQAIGISAGPVIGGLLLGAFGWRSIFWVTVPFGLAAILVGWLALPGDEEAAGKDEPFDMPGAFLLGPALVSIVLVLNQVADWGLLSPFTIGFAIAGAVLLALFVHRERKAKWPLLDFQLFDRPAFPLGVVTVAMGFALLYGMFYLASFALVRGYHDSPEEAGLRLSVIAIAIGLSAPIAGSLVNRIGTTRLSYAGMAACAIALFALAFVALEPSPSRTLGTLALALFGIGLGLFTAPNNNETMGAAPTALSGEAGAMLNLARMLGVSLGVAGAASMLTWRMHVATGSPAGEFVLLKGRPLIGAVEDSLALLFLFVLVAIAAVWTRARKTA